MHVPGFALTLPQGERIGCESRTEHMTNLMSIGRFAQLTELTVKALRLYDQRGLLRPAVIDFESGYRYYSAAQIGIAQRIRLLRSVHMPLADIQTLLGASDPEVVKAQLDRHRKRISRQIKDYQPSLHLLPTPDEWRESAGKDVPVTRDKTAYPCSFCGKGSAEVRRMVAGPGGAFICNECVTLCNEVIAQEEARAKEAPAQRPHSSGSQRS